MAALLMIDIEERERNLVVRPVGELDLATAHQLLEACRSMPAVRRRRIDLRSVSFVDLTGLRTLEQLRHEGFTLCGAQGAVRRLFAVVESISSSEGPAAGCAGQRRAQPGLVAIR